jgi:hypothetical protein
MRATAPVFLILAVAGSAPADDAPHVKAARARQEAAKTVYVEFKLTEAVPPGGHMNPRNHPGAAKILVPPRETTLEAINRLILDNEKHRYENNNFCSFRLNGNVLQGKCITAFDGAVERNLYPDGVSNEGVPWGSFGRRFSRPVIGDRLLLPIVQAFRGADPRNGCDVCGEMKPTGNTLVIDGAVCEESLVEYWTGWATSYWLDPDSDYLARRICLRWGDWITEQFDIRYRRHEKDGWAPESWVRKDFFRGDPGITTTVEVLDLRLNAPQPAERFELIFPPGAFVSETGNGGKQYQVQPDGSLREVSPSSPPPADPEPPDDSSVGHHKWLAIGVAMAFAIIVYVLAARRKRQAISPDPATGGPYAEPR